MIETKIDCLLQWALPFSNLRSIPTQIRPVGGGCYHLLTYWLVGKQQTDQTRFEGSDQKGFKKKNQQKKLD